MNQTVTVTITDDGETTSIGIKAVPEYDGTTEPTGAILLTHHIIKLIKEIKQREIDLDAQQGATDA